MAAAATIDDLVIDILEQRQGLDLLDEEGLMKAVKHYVDKKETAQIHEAVKEAVKKTQKEVWSCSKGIEGDFSAAHVHDKVKVACAVRVAHCQPRSIHSPSRP